MILAQKVMLVDVDPARQVAVGLVAIDEAEGAPPVIIWEGDAYLLAGSVTQPAISRTTLCYCKTRVMYAGASFEAVR